jgi:hypothetical protein
MKLITLLAFLVLAACEQPDVSEYEVLSSSALHILNAGQVPPAECTQVGAVAIPRRDSGFFARHLGLAEEEFFRALHTQIEPLKANLLVPSEGSDVFAAASSGEPFQGTVYSCP